VLQFKLGQQYTSLTLWSTLPGGVTGLVLGLALAMALALIGIVARIPLSYFIGWGIYPTRAVKCVVRLPEHVGIDHARNNEHDWKARERLRFWRRLAFASRLQHGFMSSPLQVANVVELHSKRVTRGPLAGLERSLAVEVNTSTPPANSQLPARAAIDRADKSPLNRRSVSSLPEILAAQEGRRLAVQPLLHAAHGQKHTPIVIVKAIGLGEHNRSGLDQIRLGNALHGIAHRDVIRGCIARVYERDVNSRDTLNLASAGILEGKPRSLTLYKPVTDRFQRRRLISHCVDALTRELEGFLRIASTLLLFLRRKSIRYQHLMPRQNREQEKGSSDQKGPQTQLFAKLKGAIPRPYALRPRRWRMLRFGGGLLALVCCAMADALGWVFLLIGPGWLAAVWLAVFCCCGYLSYALLTTKYEERDAKAC